MPRVLIACDKFKGSATSQQIADALGRGLRRVAGIEVSAIAVADGGDGTLDACDCLGYERITRTVAGPDGAPVSAQLSLDRSRHRAVIEVAAAAGLALVSRDGRIRPDAEAERATTAGVGELVLSALDEGARDVILGLGGSATTDAGAGMLMALGLDLVDASGERVTDLRRLGDVRLIDLTTMDPRLAETRFIAATDVTNPLTGPQGAAAVYGPQKGLRHDRIDDVDRALGSFATVTEDTLGCYGASQAPGAGAAGGLGFAAGTYLGAEIVSGADLLLDLAGFDELAASADVVITGEGRLDDQTLSGKAPAVVARRARDLGKAVVAVCGTCEATDDSPLRDTYTSIHALTDVNSDVAACIRDPLPLVTEIGARIGARLGLGGEKNVVSACLYSGPHDGDTQPQPARPCP